MRTIVACLGALLTVLHHSSATPTLAFPINSQVPPVARASKPFQYQFAPNTFTASPGATIQYALGSAPSWLSLQSSTRTLSGTPQSQDQGPITFDLTASDGSGSSESQVTLVVSDAPAPSLAANITEALSRSGPLSDLSSLNLHPGSTFGVTFDQHTFQGPDNLSYYATSADRSPLPSWITFNSESLTFTGTTPPPVPNPQTISLRLIASSISGFEANSVTFNLVVSDRTLSFSAINQTLDVRPDQPVPGLSLRSQLLSDGQPISASTIANANINGPSWLSIDRRSLALSGTAPGDVTSSDVRIRVSDIYGNNANTYVRLAGPNGIEPSVTMTPGVSTTMPQMPSSTSSVVATTESAGAASASTQSHSTQNHGWIAAAVIVPTAVAIAFVVLLWWCCRRRHKRKTEVMAGDQEKQIGEYHTQPGEIPPPGLNGRASEDSLGSHNQLVLDSQRDYLANGEAPHHRSQKYPSLARRRSTLMSPMKHRASRVSRLSGHSGSGSDSRRLTGLGHGRLRSFGSPTRVDTLMRVKARRRCTACGCSDVETLGSSPPSTSALQQRRPMTELWRPSIRMLPREDSQKAKQDSQEMLQELLREVGEMDSRPFQDKRSSYLKKGRSIRSTDTSKRTHDEHMYDLQKSYDRLKRELGGGSLGSRPGSRPTKPASSIRSHPAVSLSMADHPTSAGAAMLLPPAEIGLGTRRSEPAIRARSLRSEAIADSQGSNEWTDTEDGSSSSPTRGRQPAQSVADESSPEEWEDVGESAQDVKLSRVHKDSHGVPYIIGRRTPPEVGDRPQAEQEQTQTGAREARVEEGEEGGGGAFL